MPELWDLYDTNRTPLHRTLIRGEQKQPGEYHTVAVIWVVTPTGEILLTLRDPRKLDFPNKWESPGGSILAGETSVQGAARELFEETGICAKEGELVLFGTAKESSAFIDIYMLKRDVTLQDIVLQDGETVDAQLVSLEKLQQMMDDRTLAQPAVERLTYVWDAFIRGLHV